MRAANGSNTAAVANANANKICECEGSFTLKVERLLVFTADILTYKSGKYRCNK